MNIAGFMRCCIGENRPIEHSRKIQPLLIGRREDGEPLLSGAMQMETGQLGGRSQKWCGSWQVADRRNAVTHKTRDTTTITSTVLVLESDGNLPLLQSDADVAKLADALDLGSRTPHQPTAKTSCFQGAGFPHQHPRINPLAYEQTHFRHNGGHCRLTPTPAGYPARRQTSEEAV